MHRARRSCRSPKTPAQDSARSRRVRARRARQADNRDGFARPRSGCGRAVGRGEHGEGPRGSCPRGRADRRTRVYSDDRLFVSSPSGADADATSKLARSKPPATPSCGARSTTLMISARSFSCGRSPPPSPAAARLNPFDQPRTCRVEDATKETARSLRARRAGFRSRRSSPARATSLYADEKSRVAVRRFRRRGAPRLLAGVKRRLRVAARLFEETEENERLVQQIRTHLRRRDPVRDDDRLRPAFLHSTAAPQGRIGTRASSYRSPPPTRPTCRSPASPTPSARSSAGAGARRLPLALKSRRGRALRVDLGADVAAGLTRLSEIVRRSRRVRVVRRVGAVGRLRVARRRVSRSSRR